MEALDALLVGDDFIQDVLLHLLQTRGLLGRKRLADHLAAAGLHLAGGLWHVLEVFIWQDDGLDISQALAHE